MDEEEEKLIKKTVAATKMSIIKQAREGFEIGIRLRQRAREKRDSTFLIIIIAVFVKEAIDPIMTSFHIWLPVAGSVIDFIYTLVSSAVVSIALFIFFFGRGFGLKKLAFKVIVLVIAFFMEALPLVSAFPIQSIAAVWVWYSERKKDLEEIEEEKKTAEATLDEMAQEDLNIRVDN